MSVESLTAVVTAIVAVAAFLLSLYNFYVGRKEQRAVLAAKISNGFIPRGPELGELMLILEIANPGKRRAVISAAGISLGKKHAFFPLIEGTRRIPFELPPDESATFWVPVKNFAESLKEEGYRGKVRLKAFFKDALGKAYYSRGLKIDLREIERV